MSRGRAIPLYKTVLTFRILWAALAIVALDSLIPLGTSRALLIGAAAAGVLAFSRLAHSRITNVGVCAASVAIITIYYCGFLLAQHIALALGFRGFAIDIIKLHVGTCLLAFGLFGAAAIVFWRARWAILAELTAFLALSILLFSGHRDFHLDKPKILNSLAWQLHVDHLAMLILVGTALLVSGATYLYCASLAIRPRADRTTYLRAPAQRQILASSFVCGAIAALIYFIQQMLYAHFNAVVLARAANGVGMGSSEGVSPLSFQSALGSTNQPAGLVRLEGDYSNNPFSPMMYMRESALSSFNGKEMVFAGRAYDADLPLVTTRDSFSRTEDAELGQRTPLVQSVYLLADHDHVFAVDYPISVAQLKNPSPTRFKATYRAYSVAPAYTISSLGSAQVGDPRWSDDIRAHYVTPHGDPRYTELAKKLTEGMTHPIEKVKALTDHLSRTAIYTLTPNHETKQHDDPVAPFLFGDHRGYCVHFAHAIVYMARGIGIPARIGTGYLTDLSQAKDGHILLRMSDRHAWAEVFVSGIGWVPFDVQPDQVESHAETQIDSKLLEELMGVLEPGEEILPKDSAKDEAGMEEPETVWIPTRTTILIAIASLLGCLIAAKIILRHGWRIAPTPSFKLRLGYIAISSYLHDIGWSRQYGETRSEFAKRCNPAALSELTTILSRKTYAKESAFSTDEVRVAIERALTLFAELPVRTRLRAAGNPASLIRLLSGGNW
jgi:hypothetical protein